MNKIYCENNFRVSENRKQVMKHEIDNLCYAVFKNLIDSQVLRWIHENHRSIDSNLYEYSKEYTYAKNFNLKNQTITWILKRQRSNIDFRVYDLDYEVPIKSENRKIAQLRFCVWPRGLMPVLEWGRIWRPHGTPTFKWPKNQIS